MSYPIPHALVYNIYDRIGEGDVQGAADEINAGELGVLSEIEVFNTFALRRRQGGSMTEQVRSQLQMMLLQQTGGGALPLSNVTPDALLNFWRQVENVIVEHRLSPIMVYWSTRDGQALLPEGQRYRELARDAFCLSVFSERVGDRPEEVCYLVDGHGLSLVVYAQQARAPAQGIFKCAGSMDPQIVNQAFAQMLPFFQYADPQEANRLEDARTNHGAGSSNPNFVQYCRSLWPASQPMPQSTAAPAAGPTAGPTPAAPFAAPIAVPTSRPAAPPPSPPPDPGVNAVGVRQPPPIDIVPPVGEDAPPGTRPRAARKTAGASRLGELAYPGEPVTGGAPHQAPDALAGGQAPVRHVIPLAAQSIIKDIVDGMRHSSDLNAILQLAIEKLTVVGQAHRGLIWQVVGDQMTATNEFSVSGNTPFAGTQLGSAESTAIMLEFLSRFPDESGVGAISIPDTHLDTGVHKVSQTLATLIELGDVRARLVAQLRCRGQIAGFLELQQCNQTRNWGGEDGAVLQHVANTLAVVVQQARDQAKIEFDAHRMKLINQIADIFRESKGQKIQDTILKSVSLVKENLDFVNAQLYLYSFDDELLIPQIPDAHHSPVDPSTKDNPFVAVYESGREKAINVEYSRKGDPFFGHDTAVIVPLVQEGERLGVMGLWERLPNKPTLWPSDRELARTVAVQLSSVIRADQAIAQIRAEQARGALINKVSSEIRQSLKEDVDPVMDLLVQSLNDYFSLVLAVVSHFDAQAGDFIKSKSTGTMAGEESPLAPNFGELLFLGMLGELKQGQIIFLTSEQIAQKLVERQISVPPQIRSATVVPLVHAGDFKGALCMVSADRVRPLPAQDMKMIADLADRVAVVISHHELYKQVERQAVTDPMTGLYNRRHFNEQMSKEIDRYQRFGHPFSYIIVDLDYLKKINDSLGHQFGDAAIKHIAQVLKRTTRDVDTAARYGGEEFVILLPVTDPKAARIAAERVCAAIRERPVEGIGVITASVGVSTFPNDTDDRDKITELADQAMYLAKHRGRNQVCSVCDDLMPSLNQKGDEALEVQQHAIQKTAEEMAPIDMRVIAEHGILGLLGSVVKLIEVRDAYSKDRSPKAAEYAGRLAQSLHLSKDHITIISLSAVLNNLGKIAMPEDILQKKGPLTPEERKIIQQSPVVGAKILEPAKHLHRVATVIESYHEHWDGSGYPKGLKGEDIPLESRIIALVDAYIAMTSDRPYRQALSQAEAIRLIQEGSAKEWDPRLVKLFLSILQKDLAGARARNA